MDVTDEEEVDIRIRDVPEDLRQRFKSRKNKHGLTYEEFLDKLLKFYDEYEDEFRNMSWDRPSGRRRGGGRS